MNFDRLENLIVALKDAKPEKFNMGNYMWRCGTPACVLGHYAARRDLQDLLMLSIQRGMVYQETGIGCDYDDAEVQEHFGFLEDEAEELFASYGCGSAKTPADAIAYIREFIDRYKAAEVEP